MMTPEALGQFRRAARGGNNVCNVHEATMWDMPALNVNGCAGRSRTNNVGSSHNADMARKPRRPADLERTPLARRVLELRHQRGLSQVDLAAEAGVSRAHIAKIETGADAPGRETLHALAVYFGVSMDELQAGLGRSPAPQQGRFVKDAEQLAILDLWEAIPKSERPRIARMIRAAADDPPEFR